MGRGRQPFVYKVRAGSFLVGYEMDCSDDREFLVLDEVSVSEARMSREEAGHLYDALRQVPIEYDGGPGELDEGWHSND